ncbi:hypothetical protein J6590_044065 [Homalodisca vitripennis]|nr:hypothetical protein J6590_044065 [Homalodisca vitripennis]
MGEHAVLTTTLRGADPRGDLLGGRPSDDLGGHYFRPVRVHPFALDVGGIQISSSVCIHEHKHLSSIDMPYVENLQTIIPDKMVERTIGPVQRLALRYTAGRKHSLAHPALQTSNHPPDWAESPANSIRPCKN